MPARELRLRAGALGFSMKARERSEKIQIWILERGEWERPWRWEGDPSLKKVLRFPGKYGRQMRDC